MLFRWFFRLIDGHYKSPRTQKAEIIECHCFCDETERIYTGTIRNEKIMFVVLLSLSSILSIFALVEQASNKSQLGRRYSNTNLVHRNARLDYSHYYIFIRCDGAYQTNPIHQANVVNKYPW